MLRTLVVIPTLNEADNLDRLLPGVAAALPGCDLLLVDDHSEDGTAARARALASRLPSNLEVVEREGPRGLGRAYTCGLQHGLRAGYDALLTMDADLSHDPRHLPALVAGLADHDVVIGARYVSGGGVVNWGLPRIVLSWTANRFARHLLGLAGSDLTSGYRAYRRHALERLELDAIRSDGYSYLVELLYHLQRSGCRVGEVPIVFVDRTRGRSKISKREIYRGAATLLRLRMGSR